MKPTHNKRVPSVAATKAFRDLACGNSVTIESIINAERKRWEATPLRKAEHAVIRAAKVWHEQEQPFYSEEEILDWPIWVKRLHKAVARLKSTKGRGEHKNEE